MAEVGELTWIAEIKEIAESKKSAEEMSEGLEDMADQARETEDAMGQVGDASDSAGRGFGRLGKSAGSLSGMLGLAASGVFSLILQFAGLSGAAATVSGALSTLVGWLGLSGGLSGILATIQGLGASFLSWLAAGSAGALAFAAAIGAVIGLFAVWILKITGVLDWIGQLGAMLGESLPGWARDALLALISIFAGGLAVLGGVILGFMEGGLQGAIERGQEVIQIFAGAWTRLWQGVKETTSEFIGDLTSMISSFGEDIGDLVGGALRGAFNTVIPDSITLPEITVGGQSISTEIPHIGEVGGTLPEVTIGGDTLNFPQLQTGGMIEQGGGAVLHEGEMVLPADVSRDVIDAIRRAGTGGGGGGATVNIERQIIEIGDQTLDVSELDRTQMETLADLIAGKQGDELATLVG